MGKQTMGTPLHAYEHRADNKLYRILTPQTPLVRPASYDHYNIDEYPLGTNAIVAVISYTVMEVFFFSFKWLCYMSNCMLRHVE